MGISDKDFEALFKKHFVAATSYINHFVGDVDDAKDIAHKAFMKLWEKRGTIPADSNVPALLYRISHNLAINHIRDNKKFTSCDDLPLAETDSREADSDIRAAELESAIADTIRHMPEKVKQVFVLSRYEKMTNGKIAEKLGVSIKTVEAHITSALKSLRLKIFGKEK